jgi:hypothetical protein
MGMHFSWGTLLPCQKDFSGALQPRCAKRVLATEKKIVSGELTPTRTDRAGGVLRHEFGHGVDHVLGHLSHRAAFAMAYQADADAIRGTGKVDQFAYLLQPGFAGREEAFAEVFAVLHGGGAGYWMTEETRQHWPNVARFLEENNLGARPWKSS